jgi:hypothetical protein
VGIFRYKGSYVTVAVSVVTIEFGCYIASIYFPHVLFRKVLVPLLPYFFDNVAGVSLSELFNCDDKLERLDAIDIWCLIESVSLSVFYVHVTVLHRNKFVTFM